MIKSKIAEIMNHQGPRIFGGTKSGSMVNVRKISVSERLMEERVRLLRQRAKRT